MAGLRFLGVHKRYGEVEALRGLELEVADGEFMVLVGPSGCGKSTALRRRGTRRGQRGDDPHRFAGRHRLRPAQRNVAMVFQSYALFPHLSVAENIGFGLRARRVPDLGERVQRAAEVVEVGGLLERKPFQLSGGERQRVALARALAREPDVFLLDEPLSNLDAQLRVHTRAELKALHQRLEATMLYVTHDQVEALTLGDRVAVLRDGVIQQVGPPDEVYERPANRFVGRFVGSPAMNVIPAAVEQGRLRAGPFLVDPPAGVELDGRPLEVGIRPEHLLVSADRGGAAVAVRIVERAGNETFLHLAADALSLVARVTPELNPDVGSTLYASVADRRAHILRRRVRLGVAISRDAR